MPHDTLKEEILRFIGDRDSVPTSELLAHARRNCFLLHLADCVEQLRESGKIFIDPTGKMISIPQARTL
jgi:hypothetical protein